ncbi:MAG: AAA family ATPase [Ktedonobacteraceae bacterium]
MRGYPGTGKSTIARAIATALHAPLIDRDILREKAVDCFGDVPQVGRFSYELMFALAAEQLELGLSVVADTPLTYATTYKQALELAQAFHTPMLVVHCQCPAEVQKKRLEGRKGKVSEFQITSWEEWMQWKPRFEEFETEECVIDTSNPLDDSLMKVMCTISELHEQLKHTREQDFSDRFRI